jgi:hypothetical protein
MVAATRPRAVTVDVVETLVSLDAVAAVLDGLGVGAHALDSATCLPNRASPAIVGERCVVMKHSPSFLLTMAGWRHREEGEQAL